MSESNKHQKTVVSAVFDRWRSTSCRVLQCPLRVVIFPTHDQQCTDNSVLLFSALEVAAAVRIGVLQHVFKDFAITRVPYH